MKRLQVLIDNEWKYVFCRNSNEKLPITTKDKSKAIKGNSDSIDYFKRWFSSLEFRIVK